MQKVVKYISPKGNLAERALAAPRKLTDIISELAELAGESDINADELAEMVRAKAFEIDIREAGDIE